MHNSYIYMHTLLGAYTAMYKINGVPTYHV